MARCFWQTVEAKSKTIGCWVMRRPERAKHGRGKPVLILHIGFLACFHTISLERSRFSHVNFLALVALKLLVSLMSRLVACSPRIVDRHTNTQTHRTTTVTLAAHAHRGSQRGLITLSHTCIHTHECTFMCPRSLCPRSLCPRSLPPVVR